MKTGYFEESPGVKSSTRINSFILLIFMMAFDLILGLTSGFVVTNPFVLLNFVFLIGVFAPKYLHKIVEAKMFSQSSLFKTAEKDTSEPKIYTKNSTQKPTTHK